MSTNNQGRIISLLFLWGFGGMASLIGVAGVLMTYWNIQQDRASESWPEVPGEILKSRIESETTRTTTSTGTGLNKKKKTHKDTDYFVELRYAYKVEGQAYEGDRIRFASTRHDERADAQKEQRQFPKGKKVVVYYDPEKPGRSVLIRGSSGNLGQLIGLSICLLIGLTFVVFAIRSTFGKKPNENGE